ncbi:MAG: prolyl-tRNA synthetase associated domain-containing protein [Lactobacillus sp.]|nr:prolyl-tRNA synthetase associated domain-containing protein [Lactobacillus sp.]
MVEADEVFKELENRQINYKVINHPAVYTTEEANQYLNGLSFARVRNLFLDNKDNYYLVMIDDRKRLNMKQLRAQLQTRRFTFADQKALESIMGVRSGSVSPFNLINDHQRQVKVVMDQSIIDENEFIGCHPNDNTKTVVLRVDDLLNLIKKWGYEVTVLPL